MQALLRDLREWGRNLHPARPGGLTTESLAPVFREGLSGGMPKTAGANSQFTLSLEVIYGHAIKPPPRVAIANTSQISLTDMRTMSAQTISPTAFRP